MSDELSIINAQVNGFVLHCQQRPSLEIFIMLNGLKMVFTLPQQIVLAKELPCGAAHSTWNKPDQEATNIEVLILQGELFDSINERFKSHFSLKGRTKESIDISLVYLPDGEQYFEYSSASSQLIVQNEGKLEQKRGSDHSLGSEKSSGNLKHIKYPLRTTNCFQSKGIQNHMGSIEGKTDDKFGFLSS